LPRKAWPLNPQLPNPLVLKRKAAWTRLPAPRGLWRRRAGI